MSPRECQRCDGCGQLANSGSREPWTAWTSLPPVLLVVTMRLGLVSPEPCDVCGGRGVIDTAGSTP